MKSLQDHLRQYVAARRALGTRLLEPAKTLSGFTRFLGRKGSKFITIRLALEWSQQSKNVQPATWARKLSMVRQFARWLSVIEPRHQVPPPRLLNVRHRRNKPHIYSDQEIVRLMAAAGRGGVIVNIGSTAAVKGDGPVPYCTAKAAVLGMTRAMARELAGRGIRVNAVNPGATETPIYATLPPETKQAIADDSLLKRLASPDEIAAAVAFLAGDDGSFAAGSVLTVNGGAYFS